MLVDSKRKAASTPEKHQFYWTSITDILQQWFPSNSFSSSLWLWPACSPLKRPSVPRSRSSSVDTHTLTPPTPLQLPPHQSPTLPDTLPTHMVSVLTTTKHYHTY
nr:uncharacterized protein LOC106690475 [Halyomorpha halys]